ncbi:ABC transporter permease subunit [Marinivivus vitaminiproducens]|uniref:ABC transporter permease subunit n=1 Tax=Marinivivus vitaminiproducens TaxID=3035935 RepID=UPI00279931D2|nr:ABC transporter permease subunit [Geminicoccaceae bacterium SCSIO 64248]
MATVPASLDDGLGGAEAGRSLWSDAWRRLRANRAAMASLIVLCVIALACIVGPWLSPHGYDQVYRSYVKTPASLEAYPRAGEIQGLMEQALARGRVEIGQVEVDGSSVTVPLSSSRPIDERIALYVDRADAFDNARVVDRSEDGRQLAIQADMQRFHFYFGTDANGRDLMTRTLIGGRISLMIGILATGVALLIGVAYGATAGYLGGRVDALMMRLVDVLYALPFMFFVILLVVFFGRNIVLMFIAVGAIEWLDMARIVRGQTLSLKRQEFVEAAHALGVGTAGILKRHIVPNTLGPVVVFMTLMVPKVILLESFLSFLGLGVQEPMTSWGVLISEGARNIQGASWMLIFPSVFLAVTLFCLNFIGDGLRDALDPKDR